MSESRRNRRGEQGAPSADVPPPSQCTPPRVETDPTSRSRRAGFLGSTGTIARRRRSNTLRGLRPRAATRSSVAFGSARRGSPRLAGGRGSCPFASILCSSQRRSGLPERSAQVCRNIVAHHSGCQPQASQFESYLDATLTVNHIPALFTSARARRDSGRFRRSRGSRGQRRLRDDPRRAVHSARASPPRGATCVAACKRSTSGATRGSREHPSLAPDALARCVESTLTALGARFPPRAVERALA